MMHWKRRWPCKWIKFKEQVVSQTSAWQLLELLPKLHKCKVVNLLQLQHKLELHLQTRQLHKFLLRLPQQKLKIPMFPKLPLSMSFMISWEVVNQKLQFLAMIFQVSSIWLTMISSSIPIKTSNSTQVTLILVNKVLQPPLQNLNTNRFYHWLSNLQLKEPKWTKKPQTRITWAIVK